MTDKQLALVICIGALFVIGLLVFIISKVNRQGDSFAVLELLLELGVIVLDVLSSIMGGL
jgi:uncharacterized integral membrane protein